MKNASIKRKIKILLSPLFRIGLCRKDFSILSNNCWAGHYYDMFHLPYLTPTIGLFFPAKDYLKFLSRIDYYLSLPLEKIDSQKANCYSMLKRKQEAGNLKNVDELIIGRLDDVEIVCLQYDSFEEASEKWNRRKTRLNRKCLIVKYNDQNEFEEENYETFINLPYSNKVFFTANEHFSKNKDVIYLKKYKEKGFVEDDLHNNNFSLKKYLKNIK